MATNNNMRSSSGSSNVSTTGGSTRFENQKSGSESEAGSKLGMDGEASQLEQLAVFLKENWRPILTELVAAGVTAYLTHDAKTKTARKAAN
ncbi:MAG: hypothetical protein AB7F59_13125 [Bdellovibrionales bacterium]